MWTFPEPEQAALRKISSTDSHSRRSQGGKEEATQACTVVRRGDDDEGALTKDRALDYTHYIEAVRIAQTRHVVRVHTVMA
jgi:hypothetical protein